MKTLRVVDIKPLKPLSVMETLQFKQLLKYLPFEMTVEDDNGPHNGNDV